MGARSGERQRRIALGHIGGNRSGAPLPYGETLRFSVTSLDRKRAMAAKISKASGDRKDKNDIWAALQHELKRFDAIRAGTTAASKALGEAEAPLVTDHAVIRFLERCMGVDVEAVRCQIARLLPAAAMEHERTLYVRGGFQFIVRNGCLVTVLNEDMEEAVESFFSIDDKGVAEYRPAKTPDAAYSRAARLLSKRAKATSRAAVKGKAKALAAELGLPVPEVLQ